MQLSSATAFWSYAHADNDATNGHIRALAQQVAGAYLVNSGEELTLFVDRDEVHGLKWGDEWQEKINTTIAGTTFFIPIISPSYLRSANCRSEFLDFWTKAKGSDLGELLLPILYSDVDLSDETDDEICRIVRSIQFMDWRKTRLEEEGSKEYKTALDRIGKRLREIAVAVEAKPEVLTALSGGTEDSEDDDEPGLLELLAAAEEAMSSTDPNMARITEAFDEIGKAFKELPTYPPKAPMAQRLNGLKVVSKKIVAPAAEFNRASKALEGRIREIDAGINAFVSLSKDPEFGADTFSLQSAHETFAGMRDEINEKFIAFSSGKGMLAMAARMSRDMKAPMRDIQKGIEFLENVLVIISNWADATESPST
ncbi:toll/interleukin-1 receptor domain-containing protein [Rhodococcus erythropolis]|uniref:toll/interleukin-1 receptor domain-containing protein n=1 Tax=Rhodococcus erythropolis TaxID=1833 RepID=UPI0002E9944E|nr:toll/interleukin-1 receptor domain-containing protein [Rhodococcus erythropolis]EQM33467.1 hypothetical protein N601_11495 [Rhodococcus erythropolis DN1]